MSKKRVLERKMIGMIFYIPFIMLLFLGVLGVIFHGQEQHVYNICLSYEIAIPFCVAWWTAYSLYEFLEEEGSSVLFTYGISMKKQGLCNSLRYLMEYLVLVSAYMVVSMHVFLGQIYLQVVFSILLETCFFAALSFLLMTVLKDSSWTMLFLFTYVCVAYFTSGDILGEFSVYLFDYEVCSWDMVCQNGVKCFAFAGILYSLGYKLFSKKRGFQNGLFTKWQNIQEKEV